jgi:hypothetical protein
MIMNMVKVETQWIGPNGQNQENNAIVMSANVAGIYTENVHNSARDFGRRVELHKLNNTASAQCVYDSRGDIWRVITYTEVPEVKPTHITRWTFPVRGNNPQILSDEDVNVHQLAGSLRYIKGLGDDRCTVNSFTLPDDSDVVVVYDTRGILWEVWHIDSNMKPVAV